MTVVEIVPVSESDSVTDIVSPLLVTDREELSDPERLWETLRPLSDIEMVSDEVGVRVLERLTSLSEIVTVPDPVALWVTV